MAARKEYGVSWWGKKWLDALNQIDNSNRLPRGKSYANTGKVKVELQQNLVQIFKRPV